MVKIAHKTVHKCAILYIKIFSDTTPVLTMLIQGLCQKILNVLILNMLIQSADENRLNIAFGQLLIGLVGMGLKDIAIHNIFICHF